MNVVAIDAEKIIMFPISIRNWRQAACLLQVPVS